MYRVYKGRQWMVQLTDWAGPINFGIHVSLGDTRYFDVHLPYLVITVGAIDEVDYPPEWWAAARDIHSGVKFRGNNHK